jgi:glutaredoxin
MELLLYTRRGCHLCEAVEELLVCQTPAARIVDVAGDPALEAEYGLRVPVVVIDGRVVAEGRIDEAKLTAVLSGGLTGRD